MGLRILAGSISLLFLAIACAKEDSGVGSSLDAGTHTVIDGGNSDASVTGLVGGKTPLTQQLLTVLQYTACAGSLNDAGASPVTDAGSGTCSYPMPPYPPGMVIDPSKINVVIDIDSGQSFLIGQTTPNCFHGDGWYLSLDGNITLCPQTCSTVNANSASLVQIFAGCTCINGCDPLVFEDPLALPIIGHEAEKALRVGRERWNNHFGYVGHHANA